MTAPPTSWGRLRLFVDSFEHGPLQDVPLDRAFETRQAGSGGDRQVAVERVDGEPVGVCHAPGRFRATVPVPPVGSSLDDPRRGIDATRWDGGRYRIPGRDVPCDPVGHGAEQGMGQVLERHRQGAGARVEAVEAQLGGDVPAPPGEVGSETSIGIDAVRPHGERGVVVGGAHTSILGTPPNG